MPHTQITSTTRLTTPTGRGFYLAIGKDGTRIVSAHFHKRELLTISIALEAAVVRQQELGNAVEQRECEAMRDLFLAALHHDS